MKIISQKIPTDLLTAALLSLMTIVFTLVPPFVDWSLIRVPLGLLMVLFVPGYTLIAALFPCRDDLAGIERLALSFGLSIAVVPLIGLGLNYTPWGIRLNPVIISLTLFVLIMVVIAIWRRYQLPEDERFQVSFKKWAVKTFRNAITSHASLIDKALTILLIISIIASIAALIYVIVTPKQGEKFTEFYILGPGGMAYDYPTITTQGKNCTVIVGVGNQEYTHVNYTLLLSLDNSTFGKHNLSLDHNQTWEEYLTYKLYNIGDRQKLQFLLYREDNISAPYRDLHLWVNVSQNWRVSRKLYFGKPPGVVIENVYRDPSDRIKTLNVLSNNTSIV